MGLYIGAGVCFLIGGVMVIYALKLFYETLIFLRAAARTVGTVVYLAPARNSDGQATYLPVFAYRTNDGSIYQHTSTVASNPPSYKIGDTATLLYHKRNPRRARVRSFTELWLAQLTLIVCGIIGTIAGLIMFANAK
jgi:hypothetical protein